MKQLINIFWRSEEPDPSYEKGVWAGFILAQVLLWIGGLFF